MYQETGFRFSGRSHWTSGTDSGSAAVTSAWYEAFPNGTKKSIASAVGSTVRLNFSQVMTTGGAFTMTVDGFSAVGSR